jgi:hypothetical protein
VRVAALTITLAAAACTNAYHPQLPPEPNAPVTGPHPELRGHTLQLDIVDERAGEERTDHFPEHVFGSLRLALGGLGVVVVAHDAELPVRVRIVRYGARFSPGVWTGCASFALEYAGHATPIEKCVSRINTWGYGTAQDASAAALDLALGAVVDELAGEVHGATLR